MFKLLTIINSIFWWLGYDGNYSEESLVEFLKFFSAEPFNSSIHSFSYILMRIVFLHPFHIDHNMTSTTSFLFLCAAEFLKEYKQAQAKISFQKNGRKTTFIKDCEAVVCSRSRPRSADHQLSNNRKIIRKITKVSNIKS